MGTGGRRAGDDRGPPVTYGLAGESVAPQGLRSVCAGRDLAICACLASSRSHGRIAPSSSRSPREPSAASWWTMRVTGAAWRDHGVRITLDDALQELDSAAPRQARVVAVARRAWGAPGRASRAPRTLGAGKVASGARRAEAGPDPRRGRAGGAGRAHPADGALRRMGEARGGGAVAVAHRGCDAASAMTIFAAT
jgi:hypothetical protein